MNDPQLKSWGWNDFFAANFQRYAEQGLSAGRVVLEFNRFYRLQTAGGEILAEVAGRLRHEAASRQSLPAVGDWVALQSIAAEDRAVIQAVLPRHSEFARKTKGSKTEEQVIAANIDTALLVTSLNQDLNPRRVERYLAITCQSGAAPVLVLTKSDLCPNIEEKLAEIAEVTRGIPVHALSAVSGEGLSALEPYLTEGRTAALIGSSGVGKSTLVNCLLGHERQKVREIRRHDDRGQHTTRHRELILLPQGGLMLDTPGMRELQLWNAAEGVEATFDDIEALAAHCQFTDCHHRSEPNCAVRTALENGSLSPARFENYLKLQQELQHLARRQDALIQREERNRWKKLSRSAKERSTWKRGGK